MFWVAVVLLLCVSVIAIPVSSAMLFICVSDSVSLSSKGVGEDYVNELMSGR